MLERVRERLTYANVMATLAIFLALGGGAWAVTLARNSVGSPQIKKNAVKASEIAKNAVRKAEVGAGAVGTNEVANASLRGQDFAPGQLPPGPTGPPGPTFAGFNDDSDPVASPDLLATGTAGLTTINTPASGRLLAIYSSAGVSTLCSSGDGTFGLYVDGVPVPNTRRNFTSGAFTAPDSLLGVTADVLSAGEHTIQLGFDCTSGNHMGGTLVSDRELGAVLLGGD